MAFAGKQRPVVWLVQESGFTIVKGFMFPSTSGLYRK